MVSASALATPSFNVGFSPSHTALENVLSVVNNAQSSLDVEAYTFTSKQISTAIVSAQKRGVNVRVVADAKANRLNYSAIHYLAQQHVPVRLNNNYSIHHNKVMIADGDTIQTGSMNYTTNGDTHNAENVLVIRGAPEIAGKYQVEFNRLWA
ncbi:phospholipase [Yersinia pestis]|nr:phospholipase [Yersinia pestis]KZB77096.1 phospholipase [Yersinia pestis]PCN65005.1 phospholipase [Yersinia pestis]PVF66107.1 phospholipase [Yersinia pestis]PVU30094.1 phospholipase [Yersinia pestis]